MTSAGLALQFAVRAFWHPETGIVRGAHSRRFTTPAKSPRYANANRAGFGAVRGLRQMPRVLIGCAWLCVIIALGGSLIAAEEASAQTRPSASRDPAEHAKALAVLRSRIDVITNKLRAELTQRKKEEVRLEEVEVQLGDTTRRLFDLEQQSTTVRTEVDAATKRAARLKVKLDEEQRALRLLVRAALSVGRKGQLQHLLSHTSPVSAGRALTYARYLHERTAAQLTRLSKASDEIIALQQTLGQRQLRVQTLIQQTRETQEQLLTQRNERSSVLAIVNLRILDKREALARLNTDRDRLTRLISALREALAAAKVPPRPAPTPKPQPARPTEPAGPSLNPGELLEREGFAKRIGKLEWPVDGKIKHRYGTRRPQSGLTWKGIWFDARNGQAVRAVSHGQVAFADWLRGFGLLLIIDHGDGYMSLYGHNASLLKEPGDWVDTNDEIALLGDSGGLASGGLYFEIRKDGRPQNPARWLLSSARRAELRKARATANRQPGQSS